MMTSRYNKGFSLIELMIAMVLGLMLSAGIFTVFSGNKQSTDLTTTMADMQENARFALSQISNDIRMAGFQGCNDISRGGPTVLAINAPTNNLALTAATGSVVSSGSSWTPASALGSAVPIQNQNAVAGTHALSLQFGSAASYPLTQHVGNGGVPNRSANIRVDTSDGISSEPFNMQAGEFAIISNCIGADLIRMTSVNNSGTVAEIAHANSGNTSNLLSIDYLDTPSTKFMRFNSNVYYVGRTGITAADGTQQTGLYKQTLPYDANNPPTLMVPGVENMRIVFGVRTGTSTLRFIPPNGAGLNAENIESVRIGLLMASEEEITENDDDRTYDLAGTPIVAASGGAAVAGTHPRDKRFRLAFNTTVKIRNRRIE
ncbi:MAG: PilW family protein [Granulosicoccus sp.]